MCLLLVCIICLINGLFPSGTYLLPVNTRSGTFRESSYIPGIHTPDASTRSYQVYVYWHTWLRWKDPVIALTVQFNPSCGHISLCVKIVPLAVNLLPAGNRIGAVCIAVPPAAVRCCLPGACRWLGIVRDSIAQGSDICFAYCP